MLEIDTTNLNLKMNIVMEKLGNIVKQEAITRCPQEYGTLIASIESKVLQPFTKETKGEIEIGTDATDIRGRRYASFIEFGTGPIENANDYKFVKKDESIVNNEWNPALGVPLESWNALRKRKEEGLGQTMPFMRTAAFVSDQPIEQLFKEAFH